MLYSPIYGTFKLLGIHFWENESLMQNHDLWHERLLSWRIFVSFLEQVFFVPCFSPFSHASKDLFRWLIESRISSACHHGMAIWPFSNRMGHQVQPLFSTSFNWHTRRCCNHVKNRWFNPWHVLGKSLTDINISMTSDSKTTTDHHMLARQALNLQTSSHKWESRCQNQFVEHKTQPIWENFISLASPSASLFFFRESSLFR